jgi:threonyl-tRNA synthetase
MRMLIWHVDRFQCTITEKGRSPLIEQVATPETEVHQALIVFSSVERSDEAAPERVAQNAAEEIFKLSQQLKAREVVLHPFAHLFAELSHPQVAVQVLDSIKQNLEHRGVKTVRTPFGWFNELDIQAKGHPLSRLARTVTADG